MRLPWFRQPNIEPLVVTMSAVRSGERLLQVGLDDPAHAGTIAGKVGLGGEATLVLPEGSDAARAQVALRREGIVAPHVGSLRTLPGADGAYDVVVIHGVGGLLAGLPLDERAAVLRECARVLRPRGRLVVIEAGPGEGGGLRGLLGAGRPDPYVEAGGAAPALETAGFRPVRVLGEREGYRFVEGVKP